MRTIYCSLTLTIKGERARTTAPSLSVFFHNHMGKVFFFSITSVSFLIHWLILAYRSRETCLFLLKQKSKWDVTLSFKRYICHKCLLIIFIIFLTVLLMQSPASDLVSQIKEETNKVCIPVPILPCVMQCLVTQREKITDLPVYL